MGKTIEIPRQRWSSYLEALNRQVGGHPVHIEVENLDVGSQEVARRLPLQEIAFEKSGSARGDIEVRVGFDSGEVLHRIVHPVRMFVAYDDADDPECIEILSEDDAKTLVWAEHLPTLPADASASQAGAP